MGGFREEMVKVAEELKSTDAPQPVIEPKTEVKTEIKTEAKEPKTTVVKEPPKKEPSTPIVAADSEEPLPEGWADDKKESWKTLSPDLRKYLNQREKERNTGLNSKMQEADKVKKQYERYEPISKLFDPMRQNMELNGVSEATYIQRLIAAENYLRTDPKAALKWLAQSSGVKIEDLIEAASAKDPELEKRDQRIAELERRFQNQDVGSRAAVETQVKTAISEFQSAKDESGNAKYPHFQKVRVSMGALMQSGQAKDLQDAYDRSVNADPELRETLITERIKAHEAKLELDRAAKAKEAKKAGLNIKGSAPVNVADEKPKTWGAALRQTAQDLQS